MRTDLTQDERWARGVDIVRLRELAAKKVIAQDRNDSSPKE